MKSKRLRFAAALSILLACLAIWHFSSVSTRNPNVSDSSFAEALQPKTEAVSSLSTEPAELLPEERVIPVDEQELGTEVLATRRMYLAHASLRTEQVDDPDSVENQRILQSMIAAALGRSSKSDTLPQPAD